MMGILGLNLDIYLTPSKVLEIKIMSFAPDWIAILTALAAMTSWLDGGVKIELLEPSQ